MHRFRILVPAHMCVSTCLSRPRLLFFMKRESCPAQSRLCFKSNPTQGLAGSEGVLGCHTSLPPTQTLSILKSLLRDSRGSWPFWLPWALQINQRLEHTCGILHPTCITYFKPSFHRSSPPQAVIYWVWFESKSLSKYNRKKGKKALRP